MRETKDLATQLAREKRTTRRLICAIGVGIMLMGAAALGVTYNNLTADGRVAKITTGLVLAPRTGGVGRTGNTTATNFVGEFYDAASAGGCTTANDNAAGSYWSQRVTSSSSSETITATGAVVGDECDVLECAAASATNQALVWGCKVTATDTCVLRVTNASGSTISPKGGVRGCRIWGR